MLVSYRWLARHVDLSGVSAEEVARLFTLHTAEVEALERVFPHLDDVVVGHVVERERHPDADKLSVCRVDVGTGEALTIVCGAPNVASGQKVAVATVGTVLPGDFRIKKAKIRGVESCGMICSLRELELGEDHDGIWVLPAAARVGERVSASQELVDWALTIDNKAVTHRPDLWGHRGLARELAAILRRELAPLDLELPAAGAGDPWPVRIESAGCSRYLALQLDGYRPAKSPEWLRHLLLAVGQRPLELSVDVSNFVMLDLGQPNHLFDRDRLEGAPVVVRDARPGERLQTLDGAERELRPEDVLICAGDEPVALGGVMGGERSKVGPETSRLLLEVACFHGTTIRRTASRLALRTDASARFEKGLDPGLAPRAAAHVVRTLAGVLPGLALAAPPTDAGAGDRGPTSVRLRPARVRAVLGVAVPDDELRGSLARLGFDPRPSADGGLDVSVPSFRAGKDIAIEEDLIEEVGRLFGLTRIPEQELVRPVRPLPRDPRRDLVRRLRRELAGGARFHEALGYSFLPDDLARRTGVADEPCVEVVNPVAEGWQRVRRSVVPTLLGFLERNLRHAQDVRLFEIGKGYLPERADERGQPAEVHELGLVWAGPAAPAGHARFDGGRLPALAGAVRRLVAASAPDAAPCDAPGERPAWAHPSRRLALAAPGPDGPVEVAFLCELHPRVARELGLAADVAVAAVSLDRLLLLPEPGSRYRPLPRFPGVKLDVALAVPEARRAAEVAAAIERAGKGLVRDVELFDLYRGEQVGDGRKSLAYHLVLLSEDKTLTDKEAQKFLDRLAREAEALGGELRRE